jgi:integrase
MYIHCFILALTSGARESEIAALRLSDCHERYFEIQAGKGDKYRTADVHPLGLPFYHYRLRVRQQEQCGPYLFPGGRYHGVKTKRHNHKSFASPRIILIRCHVATRTLRDRWEQFCELIKIRYISFHGLRRTFATWCAEELRHQDLQDQLGHVPGSKTTDQYYRFSIPGRKFEKLPPEWKKIAAASGQKLLESQGVIELAAWRQK